MALGSNSDTTPLNSIRSSLAIRPPARVIVEGSGRKMGRTGDLVNGPKRIETQPALLMSQRVPYIYDGRKAPGKEGSVKMKTQPLLGVLAAAFLAPGLALAQAPAPTAPPAATASAITAPAQKTIGTPSTRKYSSSLIVVNARGAKLAGDKLTLEGVSPSAVIFTTRPTRGVGHMMTPDMVDIWKTGSFAKDPPNATVSVFQKDGAGVSDIVAVLKSPRIDGDKLTFDVHVLEGSIANADGPASIFIDTIWFGV